VGAGVALGAGALFVGVGAGAGGAVVCGVGTTVGCGAGAEGAGLGWGVERVCAPLCGETGATCVDATCGGATGADLAFVVVAAGCVLGGEALLV
jgi:hypothetical protein